MTGQPDHYSDRCSGRVDPERASASDFRASQGISAPESLTPAGVRHPSAGYHRQSGLERAGRRQVELIRQGLSERDLAILASLGRHRFLTSLQVQRFHFADHLTADAGARVCRRVLRRLRQLRVVEPIERRVGGVRAGSASYVWRLGPVGDQLRRLAYPGRAVARRKEPSLRWLHHCLAVADVHLALLDLATVGAVEHAAAATEPACWRRYTSRTGAREILKPDLYAVTASGEFEDHWFIELDRGTESLPTLIGKCAQYEAYRRSGREQAELGVFPLIVWVMPDDSQVKRLTEAIQASRYLAADRYRVSTLASFASVIQAGATE